MRNSLQQKNVHSFSLICRSERITLKYSDKGYYQL
nr:MAG TPA: hypothetical protein [Caudoviricetes sp.]